MEQIRKSVADMVQAMRDDDEVIELKELKEKISEVLDVDPYSTIKTTMESSDDTSTLLKHLTSLKVQVIPKSKAQMEKMKEEERQLDVESEVKVDTFEKEVVEVPVEDKVSTTEQEDIKQLDLDIEVAAAAAEVEEREYEEREYEEYEENAPRELDMVSSKISSFLNKTLEKLDADIAKVPLVPFPLFLSPLLHYSLVPLLLIPLSYSHSLHTITV